MGDEVSGPANPVDFGGEFLPAGGQEAIEGVGESKEPVSGGAGAEDFEAVFSDMLGEGAYADDFGVSEVVKEV